MIKRHVRAIECTLLFVVLPVVVMYLPMKGILFTTLWLLMAGCLYVWKKQTGLTLKSQISWKGIPKEAWVCMLRRFAISAVLMVVFVFATEPERLFSFMLERPVIWCIVMILYPILSVIPQEIIYRLFFCERYQGLFKSPVAMILASGLAFGHAHIMFNNVIAYVLSIIGGCFFTHTYIKHRSLFLVWFEHALYGCWLFTVGLGWYFYSGAQLR